MKRLENELENVNGGKSDAYIYDVPKVDKTTANIVNDLIKVARSLGYKSSDEFINNVLKRVAPIEY